MSVLSRLQACFPGLGGNRQAIFPDSPAASKLFHFLLAGISLLSSNWMGAQSDELSIHVLNPTGPILHGASGWLYGQAAPGIPTVNMMEPLQPQISAQKPADGLQHPAGDAFLVAPDYRAAGGKLLQIYMQDIYPDWTYNDLGIEEYLGRVDEMTRKIVASPNHDLFVYVPFNEPNNNWYADSGPKFAKFLKDWALVYRRIRELDPAAKIAGPGFEHFNGAAFETFLVFARDNHALPDEFTWHELHDDFYPEWYRRVEAYRASEKKIGIGPLPIVINEYARDKGDLAVPGQLVQWMTRLENSKAYGCLAFWTPAGTLADLTARIWPNRPTGAWWLYAWYGSMTGQTVEVTPPNSNGQGLQGIATMDETKHQVRAVFGGTGQPIKVRLLGLDSRSDFKAGVHVTLSRIRSSGVEPSREPEQLRSTEYALSGPELDIDLPAGTPDAAYSLVLTPGWGESGVDSAGERLAILADLRGGAAPLYAGSQGTSVSLDGREASGVRFLASVDKDGYYHLRLRYAPVNGTSKSVRASGVVLRLNDEPESKLSLTHVSGSAWDERSFRVFLAAGVNRFRVDAPSVAENHAVRIHSLAVEPVQGPVTTYEAESTQNTLGGTAHSVSLEDVAGRRAVAGIGGGAANYLQFNSVNASSPGRYHVVVTYANDEKGHKGQVEESAEIVVNGQSRRNHWFRNTFDAKVFATTTFSVNLAAGKNTIRFTNRLGKVPVIDNIQIADAPDTLLGKSVFRKTHR